jgi:alpha-beta hydrolase superfamily lysophospholipase
VHQVASWKPDVLGPGYDMATLAMGRDYEGDVIATLVRRRPRPPGRRAVLYVHGHNDYFFQRHVADFYAGLGISFYALDLRKCGRSLLPNQTASLCRSLREYYPEIDAAVGMIKRAGHELVLVSGHSAGGLIVSLWAGEGDSRNLIDGLILNSPYLSSGVPAAAQFLLDPMCRIITRRRPAIALPWRLSPRYARSLHRSWLGEWDFDTNWKAINGTPLRPAWLASIHRGQRRVRGGLDIKVPVLVLCGAASGSRRTPPPDLLAVDIVLDVGKIARLSSRLGRDVTCIQITGAIHDVFLSPLAARTRAFDELSRWLTSHAADPALPAGLGGCPHGPGGARQPGGARGQAGSPG